MTVDDQDEFIRDAVEWEQRHVADGSEPNESESD